MRLAPTPFKKIDPNMSGVTRRAELRVNDLVEFDLHGSRVIGTLVKFEDGKRVVRYWSDRIIKLWFYEVWSADTEWMDGGVPISGRSEDDNELVWDEDDGHAYFGTKVGRCYDCHVDVDPADILNERRMGNWEVPRCSVCVDPNNRPCQGCHQRQDECFCAEIEDARSY